MQRSALLWFCSAAPGRRSYRPEGYDEPEDLLTATEMRKVVETVQDGLYLLHQLRDSAGGHHRACRMRITDSDVSAGPMASTN